MIHIDSVVVVVVCVCESDWWPKDASVRLEALKLVPGGGGC